MKKHFIAACVVFASAAGGFSGYAQAQANQYDGKYSGKVTNVEDNNGRARCGAGGFLTNSGLTIQNGSFTLVYNAALNETIHGTVSLDGTILGSGTSSSGGERITGKIQGNTITGDVAGGSCRYSFQLTKR
jgi:hypothetical protein